MLAGVTQHRPEEWMQQVTEVGARQVQSYVLHDGDTRFLRQFSVHASRRRRGTAAASATLSESERVAEKMRAFSERRVPVKVNTRRRGLAEAGAARVHRTLSRRGGTKGIGNVLPFPERIRLTARSTVMLNSGKAHK